MNPSVHLLACICICARCTLTRFCSSICFGCCWQGNWAWRRLLAPFFACRSTMRTSEHVTRVIGALHTCSSCSAHADSAAIVQRQSCGIEKRDRLHLKDNFSGVKALHLRTRSEECTSCSRSVMSTPEQQSNKPHRGTGKADKVKPKFEKGKNPRAFISQSGAKASRLARQNVEKEQKKLHVPAIDRTFGGHGAGPSGSKSSTLGGASSSVDPPPVIVAVMGPPGVSQSM